MTKYSGRIGYADTVEVSPGRWEERMIERKYRGDLQRNTLRIASKIDGLNNDAVISNNISVVGDPYAYDHIHKIRYITYRGVKWDVASVDLSSPPRLVITMGGLYNGPEAEN